MFSASTFRRFSQSASALFRSPLPSLFFALTLTLGSASAAVTVIRVDSGSIAANPNGASWESAYSNLQTAIGVAGPTAENPVEIWVKTGLYRPTTDTDRSIAFILKSNMTIRGGFVGTESSINDRPSVASSSTYTVLSGDIGNNQPDRIQPNTQVNDPSIVNYDADQANAKDNSYNVIRALGVSNAALDRVVVAGGYASDPAITGPQIETMLQPSTTDNAAGFREQVKAGACGGGLFSQDSRIVIAHSWFVGNYASGPGGAIVISRGYITLEDTKVIRNFSADAGGGVLLQGATLQGISNNTFYGNISAFLAGGLLIQAETSTNEVKSYEGGLLTSLAGLTYETPSLIPPGTEGAKTPGFDLAKTKKLAKSLAKTIAQQLKKRATAKAAQAGVSIGSSAASSAASSASSALGSAYTGVTFLVTAIDLGVQIAMLLGVDPNDPFIKGWTAFSTVFNAYFTPSGLAMTLYNLVFPARTPSLLERLATFRRSEIASKHNHDPGLTMTNNRFEKNYSSGLGGGLVVIRANVNVSRSWFVENSSLCGGSAAAFFCYNTTNIEASAFVRNTSVYGDALTFGFRNISRLIQNTIVKNHSSSVNGHAIGADAGADVSIVNTVLWGNTSGDVTDTNNVNRFGGADLFATRKADLDADGLESYNSAGDAHSIYTAIIDIQNSDIQGLDRLVTGSTLFEYDRPEYSYQGTLNTSNFPNLGEGIRPIAGLGNFSRNPVLSQDIYPHPTLSPLMNSGRRDLYSMAGSYISIDSERRFGDYGGREEIGAVESDGTLPPSTKLYVNGAAASSGDGFTWDTAFKTLPEAFAVPLSQGAEIWVAPGTYYVTSNNNRSAKLTLLRGVSLVGSLPVGATSASQSRPDLPAQLTTISGNIGAQNDPNDNSYTLISGTDFDYYSIVGNDELPRIIYGVRFTGSAGNAVELMAPVVIDSCTFDHNAGGRALTLLSPGNAADNASATVKNSTFDSNSAGAIDCYTSNLDVFTSQFFSNSATTGAAIFKRESRRTSLTVERSVFYGNTASPGRGAAIDSQDWTLELYQNTFADNIITPSADDTNNRGGAGVWWSPYSSMDVTVSRLVMVNNIFSGNRVAQTPSITTMEFQQFGYSQRQLAKYYSFTITGNNIEGLDTYATFANSAENVDFDPFFINKANHDFRLQADSYLLNRGVISNSPTDKTAIIATRDIGAFESASNSTLPVPLQPVIFTTLPPDDDGRVFTIQLQPGLTDTTNYVWQIRTPEGSGFIDIIEDTRFSGVNTDTLKITNPGRDMNRSAFRLRFTANGNTSTRYSANHILNVLPGIIYVVPGGRGLKNGGSWANAYQFINDACNNVVEGTQVWVAAGTYGTGRYQPGNTVINQSYLNIPAGVGIYGGFVGTETLLSQRPAFNIDTTPDSERTFLTNGDANTQLINISGTSSVTNRIDRISLSGNGGASGRAIIANGAKIQFTDFRNGYQSLGITLIDTTATFTNSRFYLARGEALTVLRGSLSIANSSFANNGSRVGGNSNFGALTASDTPVKITDTTFSNNYGINTSAITAYGSTSLDIQRSVFRANAILGGNEGGGAILYVSSSPSRIANSVFDGNHSGRITVTNNSGSAIRSPGSGLLTLLHCTIASNVVDRGPGSALEGNIALVNSIVWGNTHEITSNGGVSTPLSPAVSASVTVTNSYVQGRAPLGFYEPFFKDPSASDYSLTYASPMRDLVLADDPNTGATDLAGNARKFAGGLTDLGAYEFSAAAPAAVPILSKPAAVTAFAENPASFTLVAVSSFTWEYLNGGNWIPVNGHDGWSVTQNPVTAGGMAATAYTVSNTALPVAYVTTPLQLRARAVDNPEFAIPASLTVNARHVIFVKPSAISGADGLSWATAYPTISTALAASDAGTDLWITTGDYTEPSIPSKAYVRYYPGFSGNETLVTQRNAVTRPVNLLGAVSKLPYNPADSRTAPANSHQITVAPSSAASYIERPVSFSATASSALIWQYSADSGTTWAPLTSLGGWTVTANTDTGLSVASLTAVTANLNTYRFRANVVATGEFSTAATLTAKPRHFIYVNAAAASGGNGLSWASAFKTVAAALAAADDGADLWIVKGTYSEPTLAVTAGTKLYGGFLGNETDLSQRNAVTNPVVVNGTASVLTFNTPGATAFVYQIATAPVSSAATIYEENPISFSATRTANTSATLTWQISANGTEWTSIASGTNGWTVTTTGNTSTLTHDVANIITHNGKSLRVIVTATGEVSGAVSLAVVARTVLYVKPHLTGAADGTSWTTAFKTISAALAASNAGTDLWIARGDYTEPNIPNVPLVRYYPGFAGLVSETSVTARNTALNPVRLIGAASFLPYAPANIRTAPANIHQITAAPASAAPYVERAITFSSTSSQPLVWQYSTASAPTTWATLSSLGAFNITTESVTGTTVASLGVTTANLNGLQLQTAITATGETSFSATLTATPRVILRVDSRVSASGDGLSWPGAFKTLIEALSVANEGTDIWVAAGTYAELQLNIPDGAHIYPGFAGTETSLAQRNVTTNAVLIKSTAGTVNFSGTSTISTLRYNIITAPRETAPYIANPVAFSATRASWSTAPLFWEYSTNSGATWQTAVGLADWTIATVGATTTISHPAAPTSMDGWLFRVVAPGVNEVSSEAKLIVKARITRYLNGAVSASGNGTTWATAYKTLTEALAHTDNGTDLWIAAGDYTEPTHAFVSGAAIYGGFIGTETALTQRNVTANVVTLRSTGGSIFTTNLTTLGSLSGATYLDGVTLALGTNPNGQPALSLTGTAPYFANVTFTGHAQAVIATGGILIDLENCRFIGNTTALTATGGTLVLDDCIFTNNVDGIVATLSCSLSIDGGAFTGNTGAAIRLGTENNSAVQPSATLNDVTFSTNAIGIWAYAGNLTLTECDFDHHTDTAIYAKSACTLTITNGTFANNTSNADGAAIRLVASNSSATGKSPTLSVTGTTFTSNSAQNGGAIDAFTAKSVITLTGATFNGNTALSSGNTTTSGGGAIRVRENPAFVVTGSTFIGNSGKYGGAIIAYQSTSATIASSMFTGNSASNYGIVSSDSVKLLTVTDTTFKNSSGAPALLHSGDYTANSTANITRSVFTGNLAGALSVFATATNVRETLFADNRGRTIVSGLKSRTSFAHVTIANNVANDNDSAITTNSDGTANDGGSLTIVNSILWNNTNATPPSLDQYFPIERRQINITDTNRQRLYANTIIMGLSTFGGTALINVNPHFIDAANGNYRLSAYSNAIDKGSPAYVLTGETDLAGNARNQVTAPDLGAYESASAAALVPSFTLPTNYSASLDGTVSLTQPPTAGYTTTWQYNDIAGWHDFTVTTSSGYARSIAIDPITGTITFTGLKSGINWIRAVVTNGHDTYYSPDIRVNISAFSVIYVDASVANSGNGTSWNTAVKTLTEALTLVDGDRRIIWIAAGNYPSAVSYKIPQGVEVYGGFPVGGSTFANRTPSTQSVVFSGGDTEVVRFIAGNTALSQSVLDGVSVTGGQTGVLVDSFSPTLRSLVISGNIATGLVLRSSNALVETSTIDSNTGIDGGGIAVLGGSGTPTFRRLFIRGNTAVRGGGVYSASGSNFYIWSSLISGNLAARGAGFYVGSYPTAEQVTIASNRATTTGSAIHVDGGSRIVLRNSIVWNNGTLTAALTTDNSNFNNAYLLDFNAGQDATVDYYSQLTYNPYFPSPASPADAPTTAGVYTVPAFSQTRDRGTPINSNNNGALDLAGQPRVAFGSPDLGAYEGTDAIATPYRVTSSPTAATFRRDGMGNTFTASATNATGYEWQIAGPDGVWVSLVDNAAFSGARSSTLTVLNASYSLNGYRIRAVINGPGGLLYTTAATLTVYPNRYYVKAGATTGGNGDSWATAFTSLQAALTAIPYDTSGTEIWVSAGTYITTANTLSLRPGQLVYGGFAGTESSLAERNLAANVTRIVAAANSARTFNLLGNGTTGFAFRLDGLTIDATTAQTGTAIYNESTRDLVLEHVTVVRHERSLYQAAAANTTDTVGSLTVRYSEFRGNGNANIDASFQVIGGSTLIENSLFSGNRARLFAAAYIDAPTVLRHITVAGNRGYTAFYITDVSTETYNSVFWGNRYEGAAVTSILPLYRETGLNNIIEGYAPALFNVLETDIETNRDLDPGFVSPVAATSAPTITGDYRLLATSAAIDNGDDTETGTSSTDLAGSPRVSSVHVDSGAYEYQGTDLYRIAKQPVDSSAVSSPAIFNVVVAPLTASYVWEESTDNGATFTALTAATEPSFTVAGSVENHGRLYRVQVQFATGPLLVSNVVTLTSIKAIVSADIPGGYGTPRVYNASANFAPDSWQWEVSSDGTTFTDVSGETAATLSVLGDSSYANRSYRARAIYTGGVSANSNAVAFAFADVPVVPGTVTSSIASNLSFNVTGGVESSTLTDAAISVHAGLSGRLTLADFEAPLISGDNVTLNFSPAPHAGERIQVTTTSSLARTDGLGIRPQVWEFRAPVISGVGAFSAPVAISTSAATAFALGDLNADGTVDALVATASGLQVFSNNGSATFTASGSTFGSSASAIVLGSLASSGALDAVVINGSGDVQLWANNGTGTFILTQTLAGLGAQAIAVGDVNADGDLDLVIGTATGARVLLNDGSGNFTVASTFGSGSVKVLAIGDLDQDGDLDVVTTGETGTTVWSNNGSALYTAATTVSDNFDRVALADLDSDGRLDVVLVRTGAPAVLWHNTGNATFTTLVAAPGGGVSTTLATGDIDGDGKIDLVLTDAAGRTGAWLTSAGLASTRYADQPYFTLGDAAELADLDGDGALDLFALNRAGIPMVASYHLIGVTGNEDTQFGPVLGGFVPTPFYDSIDITILPAHGTLFLYGQPLVNRNQYGSYGSFNKSALATLAYRPNANFTGLDSFGWRNSLNDSTHTYWISVSNVIDDVVAVADTITTLEGDSINTLSDGSINVLANDLNPDPGALVASLVTGPVHGTVTLSANGLFNYVHDGSATTSDSFTYLATNSTTGRSSSATVTIGITRHNVTPALLTFTAAAGTHYTGQPAGDTVGTLSATDTDPLDDGLLVYSLVSGEGSNNNVEFTLDGASLKTASPIDATNGLTRSVRIRVTDTLGTYSEQTFTLAFTQAPTALAISITTIEDNVIPITLSGSGGIDALSYEITGSPAHGTLSPSTLTAAANSYDYTPNANFNGTDTFTFRVTDSALVSTSATVTITVNSVEDLPTLATVSPITINEDNATTFTLNGYDGDGDALTYQLVNTAAFGTVQTSGADVTYTPNANANGVETLTFAVSDGVNVSDPIEVTINVTAVNDAPVIGTIAARSVTRNQSDSFTVVVTDIENSATTLRVGSPAQHGVVTITDHTVQYVPSAGFTGADNFTLIANDGELDSAPVAVSVAIAPIAAEQVELTVYRGLFESTSIPAYTGVGEWSNVVPANLSTPAHGTVAVVGSTILYTHDGSEPPVDQLSDTDTFTYTVTNATDDIRTITVTVTIKDHVLLVTNGNDTGAGSLRNALDTVKRFSTETLTPAKTTTADWSVLINIAPDFLGNRALIARTYDWSGPPAQLDHTSPNDFPSAYRIMGKVTIDAAASPGLLFLIQQDFQYYARSFYVPAGSSLTLKNLEIRGSRANRDGFRDSLGGAIRNLGNFSAENVVFRSNIANVGSAIYNDGGTVSLTDCSFIDNNVEPYNPTLGGVIYSRNGTVNLTGVTFSDPVNPELYIEASGANGVATINVVDSTIPTFVLVSHNGGTFASNGLPRAVGDALIYPVGQAFTIDITTLLANDIGTPAVSVIADATSTKGVTITRTGNNLVYQAPTGITNNDTFTYTVTDAAGLKSTATVTLTFQNPLGAPEGNADTASVYRGLYSSIDVLANDVDPRSEPLTVTAVGSAAHGSTAIVNNRVLYTHDNGTATDDTFTYSVSNATGTTTDVTVNVAINDRVILATNGADSGNGTLRAALAITESFGLTKLTHADIRPDWQIQIVTGDSGWTTTGSINDDSTTSRAAFKITTRVTIEGPWARALDVDGNEAGSLFTLTPSSSGGSTAPLRLFTVTGGESGGSLTLKNIKLVGFGGPQGQGGGMGPPGPSIAFYGGGVLNRGTFVADNVDFVSFWGSRGAAFYNDGGTASLTECRFTNNYVQSISGSPEGIVTSFNGTITLTRNIFADDYANPEVYIAGSGSGGNAVVNFVTDPSPEAPPQGYKYGFSYRFEYYSNGTVTVLGLPILGDDTIERPRGKTSKFLLATILANDTGTEGATITFANSQHGYAITRSGSFLLYRAPAGFNDNDSFTYTVTTPGGVSRTATVHLNVIDPPDTATVADTTMKIDEFEQGRFTLRIIGVPGRKYLIQRCDDFATSGNWYDYHEAYADAQGIVLYTDPQPFYWDPMGSAQGRFYRAVYNK